MSGARICVGSTHWALAALSALAVFTGVCGSSSLSASAHPKAASAQAMAMARAQFRAKTLSTQAKQHPFQQLSEREKNVFRGDPASRDGAHRPARTLGPDAGMRGRSRIGPDRAELDSLPAGWPLFMHPR